MATFTVTTLADTGGAGSLRAAVARANATAAADTIVFAPSLEGGTVTLTRGQLNLTGDVTIDGDRDGDGTRVTLDGNGEGRVLAVTGGGTDARLAGLVVTGGRVDAPTDDVETPTNGAGILLGAGGELTIAGCAVRGNVAGGTLGYDVSRGGGVSAGAGSRLTVLRSTIEGNSTNGDGGGIHAAAGAEVVVTGSRLTGNEGTYHGGGIALDAGAALSLARSLVSGNGLANYNTGAGGGIFAQGARVEVAASTISGNDGYQAGGGIAARGSRVSLSASTVAGNSVSGDYDVDGAGISAFRGVLTLEGSTVTGNRASAASNSSPGDFPTGGILMFEGELRLAGTIVAGNFGIDRGGTVRAEDIGGRVTASDGHNVFGSAVAGETLGDLEGVAAARLFAAVDPATGGGRLAANGSPTPTAALRDAPGNPALSGGEPVAAGAVDQRGIARPAPAESNPDVGAFELAQGNISRSPTGGNDVLAGTAAAQTLDGLAGADLILGRGGADILRGAPGGDTLVGGAGDDRLDGGIGRDTASYRDATGSTTASLAAGAASGGGGSDVLRDLENLEGGRFADGLSGDARANWLGGQGGGDRLSGLAGADVLRGGAGGDHLAGGLGRDRLEGGAGADLFDFDRLADSAASAGRAAADVVVDFDRAADTIDLAGVDARSAAAGDQAFAFLAAEGAAFTGAGQLRWVQDGGDTFVEGNVDADGAAELQIRLTGLTTLAAADFVL